MGGDYRGTPVLAARASWKTLVVLFSIGKDCRGPPFGMEPVSL